MFWGEREILRGMETTIRNSDDVNRAHIAVYNWKQTTKQYNNRHIQSITLTKSIHSVLAGNNFCQKTVNWQGLCVKCNVRIIIDYIGTKYYHESWLGGDCND